MYIYIYTCICIYVFFAYVYINISVYTNVHDIMRYNEISSATCMEATTFEWFLQLGDPKMSYIF